MFVYTTQVAVAAMDVYRRDIVTDCLKELRVHFDRDSFRVRRLEAMRAEMLEDWDLALEILDQVRIYFAAGELCANRIAL